ncbi:MAG: hypothetical protein K2M68_07430 [Muribaculaceae bacterium]|nr:hypothetical protein [Muribaculaceae bacterium]
MSKFLLPIAVALFGSISAEAAEPTLLQENVSEKECMSPARGVIMRKPGKPSVDMGEYSADTINLITKRPAGELKIYNRSGIQVSGYDSDDDKMEIRETLQSSTVSVVFGSDNRVWIKNPISAELHETWVPGTLSADGKRITVPMFKFIDYMPSIDFGRQMCVCTWDEDLQMYMPDMTVNEVTYTVNGNSISLDGFNDTKRILSHAYRAKGETEEEYHYDGTWGESGDTESVYTLADVQPVAMNTSLESETWRFGTTWVAGYWRYMQFEATMATDGDVVYLSGISDTDSDWCIKGVRSGNELRFPSGQFLGTSYDNSYYLAGEPTGLGGNDIVFTLTDDGLYHCFQKVYFADSPRGDYFYWYYDGIRLTTNDLPETAVMPEGLNRLYEMNYQGYIQSIEYYYDSKYNVQIAIKDDEVFIGGLYYAPNGVIKGRIENGKAIFDANQYLGDAPNVPECWFVPFDNETRQPVESLVMDYNPGNRSFTNPNASISISTMDYRNVGIFWYFNPSFRLLEVNEAEPMQPVGVELSTSPYTSDLYLSFSIPTNDVNGEGLIEDYLGYTIIVRTPEGDEAYNITHDHVESIPEDSPVTVAPYNLIGSEINWTMGYHTVRMMNMPETATAVGVQTVYTGGNAEHRSETVWTLVSSAGIDAITADDSEQVIYDLMGRRIVGKPGQGIYIVNGKKTVIM